MRFVAVLALVVCDFNKIIDLERNIDWKLLP